MIDSHSFRQHHTMLLRQLHCLFQFFGIQRNGFFAQHMLASCQRFPQKVNVSVMGCGNINDIHRRIRTYILKARKHLLHTVFFRKGHCLLRRPVHDTIQFLSSFFHSLRQLICNDTAACTYPVCHPIFCIPFHASYSHTSLYPLH